MPRYGVGGKAAGAGHLAAKPYVDGTEEKCLASMTTANDVMRWMRI